MLRSCSSGYSSKAVKSVVQVATLLLVGVGASNAHAEVFFQDDFESKGLSSGPSPSWYWNDPISPEDVTTGAMYAPEDIYYVTDGFANNGNHALALNFAGRNDWCNTCGAETVAAPDSILSSGCFDVAGGVWENYVYNQSNGFSRWQVKEVNDSLVCIDVENAIGESMFGASETSIAPGDEFKIPRQCGVNGNVGGDINRRSDCNKAINYLNGVDETDVDYGEVISRRFHVYIPSSTKLPDITFKLGYSTWVQPEGTFNATLKLSVQRDLMLELSMPNRETAAPQIYAETDKWMYFEEVFQRESSEKAGDAEYHLYMASDAAGAQAPVVSRTGFNIGKLKAMSMHGNWQHFNDASGFVYFDDILISDAYVGPVFNDSVQALPAPPDNLRLIVIE